MTLFSGWSVPVQQDVEEDAVLSVFLFTDGQVNEGVTHETKLVWTRCYKLHQQKKI